MRKIHGTHVDANHLESHRQICDLINFDHPFLSLYSDGRRNWMYLWCDHERYTNTHRWLLFRVDRSHLVKYLEKDISLQNIILNASKLLLLDTKKVINHNTVGEIESIKIYRSLKAVQPSDLDEYMPLEDSFFDESLTDDLDLNQELVPSTYDVPIDGTWFGKDFEHLFKVYERTYAFFYATKPRFVKTIKNRLQELMRAPWTGGFSRINLYSHLAEAIPALHTLKVKELNFASPGEVKFEAVSSIGESIKAATLNIMMHRQSIDAEAKSIKRLLTVAGFNKSDFSDKKNSDIALNAESMNQLRKSCSDIGNMLGTQSEFMTLESCSPNSVVFGKAVLSFVRQINKLAELEDYEMLNFSGRQEGDA